MKKLILILALLPLMFKGQDELYDKKWKVGKEKTISGNTVLRKEGEITITGITNISYETFEQVYANAKKTCEDQMYTEEKTQMILDGCKRICAGGQIHLYITRLSIESANTKYFTAILKDTSGVEIYREELKSKIPSVPESGSDYWSNYKSISIPKEIKSNVTIYIIDALGRDVPKYVFEVKI